MVEKISYVDKAKSSSSQLLVPRLGGISTSNSKDGNNIKHSRSLVLKGYDGWLKIKNLPLDDWCRSTFEVIGNHLRGLIDIAIETLNLTNCSDARIQVDKNLCGFVLSTFEITDLKRGNIYLHFGDFEFLNPPRPSKVLILLDDFKNSIDRLKIRDVLLDEDLDVSSFPSVLNASKSVFAALPRSRNHFAILKLFPAIPPALEKKTETSN
ncbi:uncharacterized protein E5676_scaffold325G00720 [Cucumis melo var. makuwa]|uniref:Uncharacterized protein n=1 Tax=Cucumis melo var. makuwa TaxID=1194695 RepID=A0A5D3DVS9_CUCMM|nr:uncharacterized protein E6C27_scaffold130G00900 [Cucumis melo var. makuwa]TYK27390.1 uncharacterized protein E5676_scaffold325G00720 [Cucumis melo var. makuwa]